MHILIIDDEKKIALQIKRALEDAQFTTTVVHTGKEAVRKTEVFEFDVIILDYYLPDIDGIDVCKQMREKGVTAPILMLTVRDDIESRVSGLDAGADDYLIKPFSYEELTARLRALLRRDREGKSSELCIKDLELNPSKYTVKYKERNISLTSKEYKLLDYLMRHVNQVCTKLMLEEHIWGSRYGHMGNIVEVTISRLRRKLDKVGVGNFITTRHGLGYVVED